MADKYLESSAISAFCSSLATMMAAGVQTDEAVQMLAENREQSQFKSVCDKVYGKLIEGLSLADAMDASGAFPSYAVEMVRVGEQAGRTERVLRTLGHYYENEDNTFAKLRNAVGYPAALLCIMSVILAFTVVVILPIFTNAYDNMAGSLTAGSFSTVGISIGIGWAALVIVLVATVLALYITFRSRTETGRIAVMRLLEKMPGTKSALHQMALSRFTSALAAFIASGVQEDVAMEQAMATVGHDELMHKLKTAHDSMTNLDDPRSLAQAIVENEVFEPVYGRMLLVGTRSGSTDDVLAHLSDVFFEDATLQLDRAVNSVEPVLAAFLTVAVGATLIAVMLPLIGIMGSIA